MNQPRSVAACLAVLLLLGVADCKHVGNFIWVDQYRPPPGPARNAYVIARGDALFVRVYNQEAISGKAKVRGDGMISLPFLNDVEAAGMEPTVLARRLQAKLKEFIVNPVVTVTIEEQSPTEISVLGEVAKPGVYHIDQDAGLLKVLALAGGLTELAGRDRIFVLRQGGSVGGARAAPGAATAAGTERIRFAYEALAHAQGAASQFRLRSGDVVVVE